MTLYRKMVPAESGPKYLQDIWLLIFFLYTEGTVLRVEMTSEELTKARRQVRGTLQFDIDPGSKVAS